MATKKSQEAKKQRVLNRNERIRKRNEEAEKKGQVRPKKQITPNPAVKGPLTIEICIHCYNYQHRLCWMLSSILQQKGDVPNIVINISYAEGNGDPTTEEVCEFFKKKGLNIKQTVISKEKVHNRAVARNRQVAETEAHWMLFADSDMVYDPYFFDDLQKQLKGRFKDVQKVMGADRVSLNIPFCIKHFENDKTKYPCVIKDVAEITRKWPVKWVMGKRTCAGYFQLASVHAIKTKGKGKYVGRARDYWRGTRSDRGFRCRMGGRMPIDVKPQYHLNHDRGGPEIQR